MTSVSCKEINWSQFENRVHSTIQKDVGNLEDFIGKWNVKTVHILDHPFTAKHVQSILKTRVSSTMGILVLTTHFLVYHPFGQLAQLMPTDFVSFSLYLIIFLFALTLASQMKGKTKHSSKYLPTDNLSSITQHQLDNRKDPLVILSLFNDTCVSLHISLFLLHY